jgi:hypothetical protein
MERGTSLEEELICKLQTTLEEPLGNANRTSGLLTQLNKSCGTPKNNSIKTKMGKQWDYKRIEKQREALI